MWKYIFPFILTKIIRKEQILMEFILRWAQFTTGTESLGWVICNTKPRFGATGIMLIPTTSFLSPSTSSVHSISSFLFHRSQFAITSELEKTKVWRFMPNQTVAFNSGLKKKCHPQFPSFQCNDKLPFLRMRK